MADGAADGRKVQSPCHARRAFQLPLCVHSHAVGHDWTLVARQLAGPFCASAAKGGVVGSAIAITVVVFIIMQVKSSEIQPFIYFQF